MILQTSNIRVPIGMLTTLAADTIPFRWEFSLTRQRAFEEIKGIVAKGRDRYCVPLK